MHTRLLLIVLLLCVSFVPNERVAQARPTGATEGVPSAPNAPPTFPLLGFIEWVSGLQFPVQITQAGDGSGRVYIVEQGGQVRVWQDGSLLPDPFLDIRMKVSCCGEQGLLSIAFPPGYAEKRYFYADYTDTRGTTIVARYHVPKNASVADPNSEEVILSIPQPYANHNGGQLAFGPRDGYLYIGTGDGGSGGDPENRAQNPAELLGKVLRVDVESWVAPYAIPSTNPYTQTAGYRGEIWALGLRNPWRFAFDRLTGDLYIGDVGQAAVEEIDFQAASSPGGENYGWRIMEGTHCYNPATNCSNAGLTLPIAQYGHDLGCSVTGGTVYRGTSHLRLRGIYVYGDYCSGRIWGLTRQAVGGWVSALLADTPFRITAFGEDEAGELYVTDYSAGKVYRLIAPATYLPLMVQ